MKNEKVQKNLKKKFILEKYLSYKNEKRSESETSEPEDSEKSNWSERPVR